MSAECGTRSGGHRRWRTSKPVLLGALTIAGALWMAAPSALAGPGVVWGPVLSDITPTSVRIAWRTNVPAVCEVLMERLERAQTSPGLFHEVELVSLTPGSTNTYRIQVSASGQSATTEPASFVTPLPDVRSFRFVAYGDTRNSSLTHRAIAQAICAQGPAFVLHTGDLVGNGAKNSDWHQFFGAAGGMVATIPFYACPGNHEGGAPNYYQILPLPRGAGAYGKQWYAFRYGSCLFLSLDTTGPLAQQTAWARQQLAAAPPEIRWRLAFFHHPPYSSVRGEGSSAVRQLATALEQGGVDMVLCGHDHAYERSEHGGTIWVTTGGGGAPLYRVNAKPNPYQKRARSIHHFCTVDVSPDSLTLRALTVSGQEIDHVCIANRRPDGPR